MSSGNISNKFMNNKSREAFAKAKQHLVGGVNSPVRSFASVADEPIFFKSVGGCEIEDLDGNTYIDFVNSWGPAIVGHANDEVATSIKAAMENGFSFGAPSVQETELAEKMKSILPFIDKVRLVSSGTEACMSALRLARGFTGKEKIVKFTGCYHGHADSFLVKAGSGALTLGLPDSPGVPVDLAKLTLTIPFNNLEAVHEVFENNSGEIAAVILEPVMGNAGMIAPNPGFLESLREICDAEKAVLIFDEVMTGFRVHLQGAAGHFGVVPDLVTYAKVLGGGMPLAAFAGKKHIMQHLAPEGPVYQAGTLSGNPLAVAAGLTTLDILQRDNPYAKLEALGKKLCDGLKSSAEKYGIIMQTNVIGGMFGFYFHTVPVERFEDALGCDKSLFGQFHSHMLRNGVYFAPSAFEAGFINMAHTDSHIDSVLRIADEFFSNNSA